MKKYLVCPGYVRSKNDGDRHFISAHRLMNLYGVRPGECFVHVYGEPPPCGIDTSTLISLFPSVSGNYALPP